VSFGWLTAGSVVLAAALVAPSMARPNAEDPSPATDRCSRRAQELFGQAPPSLEADHGVPKKGPRLLRMVKPSFPENARTACSILLHEALVSPSGSVVTVWPVRRPKDPECPEFEDAATTAIRQWKYEPFVVSEKAVPLCVIVTTNIHLVSR
jgi:hypothetical protein